MLDFDRFEWISFDCYGTLVDWETGISTAVGEVLESHGVRRSRAEVLALFADVEPRVQDSKDYLEYRTVLRRIMAAIRAELGLDCTESELGCLADTLPEWRVFPDVVDALNSLKTRCKLAVISNVDDDLFAGTAEALGVDFDVSSPPSRYEATSPACATSRPPVPAWRSTATGGSTSQRVCTMTSARPTSLASVPYG